MEATKKGGMRMINLIMEMTLCGTEWKKEKIHLANPTFWDNVFVDGLLSSSAMLSCSILMYWVIVE